MSVWQQTLSDITVTQPSASSALKFAAKVLLCHTGSVLFSQVEQIKNAWLSKS